MKKDVDLFVSEAKALGVPINVIEAVAALLKLTCDELGPDKDITEIIKPISSAPVSRCARPKMNKFELWLSSEFSKNYKFSLGNPSAIIRFRTVRSPSEARTPRNCDLRAHDSGTHASTSMGEGSGTCEKCRNLTATAHA